MFVKKFKVGDLVRYVGPLPLFAGLVGRVASQFYAHAEGAWKYKIKFPGEERPSWFDQSVLQHHQGDTDELSPTSPAVTVADAVGAIVSAKLDYQQAQEALRTALQEEKNREEAQRLADEEKARKTAVLERLHYEQELARTTMRLLDMVESSVHRPKEVPDSPESLAKFRHELQPLAETYGYTIVPVGDGTRATISLI